MQRFTYTKDTTIIIIHTGHCELARRTGAVIYYGPGAASRTQFPIHELEDGEARATAIHTYKDRD